MMRHLVALFALSTLAIGAQAPDPRLTVADVEQATATKPVHLVGPGALPGAGSGLNFATADNRMLLMVNFGTDALYKRAKEQKEQTIGGMKLPMVLYHTDVKGIGDEAFDSPLGPMQYVLYLRKGTKAASVTTYIDPATKKPRVTMEQIKAVGKIVASRM